jgi:hypothetical protein
MESVQIKEIYDRQKPLLSIHVPKCAGTSFGEVLAHWYGEGFKKHYRNPETGEKPGRFELYSDAPERRRIPGLCIHGHFNWHNGFGVDDYYPGENQRITILRDPWEMHISNYFFAVRPIKKQQSGAAMRSRKYGIREQNWSLDDYLTNRPKCHLTYFLPQDLTTENFKERLEEHFIFMGIAEDLETTVEKLAELLGMSAPDVPIKNSAARSEAPSDRQEDIFRSNNELEIEIYQYVLEKFNRQKRQQS